MPRPPARASGSGTGSPGRAGVRGGRRGDAADHCVHELLAGLHDADRDLGAEEDAAFERLPLPDRGGVPARGDHDESQIDVCGHLFDAEAPLALFARDAGKAQGARVASDGADRHDTGYGGVGLGDGVHWWGEHPH